MDDFLFRAALGAGILAAAAGPIGCFVLWRRMAYVGESVSHIGLLGAGIGILLGINVLIGTAVLATAAALVMARAGSRLIPADTHVGIVGHISLALGFILLSGLDTVRADLLGYLFGDVLALSPTDLIGIGAAGAGALAATAILWRPLLRLAVGGDIAAAEGRGAGGAQTVFLILVALLVAFGLKVVGALMIVALLIVPPATARFFAASPERMAALAALFGAASVPIGLAGAYLFDVPAGPAIVLAAGAIYVSAAAIFNLLQKFRKEVN
jgi:zinc transport system permease protein